MNKTIQELVKQSMEPSGVDGLGGSYLELNPEKFAQLLVEALVDTMEVDGSEFYYNEFNEYGSVTVKFFVGCDPRKEMCGPEVQGLFVTKDDQFEERGTGSFRLNRRFAEYLLGKLDHKKEV
ncbi:MAG: hypothetical protein EB023_12860 [Flavobacteriia bacterium]|nr:hypothetical protein [Flavobacteriia bacterium]